MISLPGRILGAVAVNSTSRRAGKAERPTPTRGARRVVNNCAAGARLKAIGAVVVDSSWPAVGTIVLLEEATTGDVKDNNKLSIGGMIIVFPCERNEIGPKSFEKSIVHGDVGAKVVVVNSNWAADGLIPAETETRGTTVVITTSRTAG